MLLSIIIVNWNVKDLLERCLASLYRETRNIDFEVIVVDNASKDGSVEMVKEKFPQVKLIANKDNKWFAGGNNQGLAIAKGELVLLLNPDTEILDGAIEKMVGIMGIKNEKKNGGHKVKISNLKLETNNDIGILGCKLLNPDMTLQPSCRRLPRLSDQILILLKLHNFFPRLKPVREYYMSDFNYDSTREVEQVMGACLMTRKEIIDKIGGLDENYGSIFEEVDFCKRALNAPITSIKRGIMENKNFFPSERGNRGAFFWKIYFTDQAQIIHHKGQSFRQKKIITNQKNFNRALLRYFKKYKLFIEYVIILILCPVSMFLAFVDQMMILAGFRGFKAKFKRREF
ncbi:MAG: glycosyltransferase family 2 protein [bacterium]